MEDEDKNSKSIGSNTVWVRPPPSALKSSLKSKDFWLLFFLTHFFSYFCVLGENADDGIGRGHFAGEIQMCINVACCADVAVTQLLSICSQAGIRGSVRQLDFVFVLSRAISVTVPLTFAVTTVC